MTVVMVLLVVNFTRAKFYSKSLRPLPALRLHDGKSLDANSQLREMVTAQSNRPR